MRSFRSWPRLPIFTRLEDQDAAELVEPEEDASNVAGAVLDAAEPVDGAPGAGVEEEPAELADGDLDEQKFS